MLDAVTTGTRLKNTLRLSPGALSATIDARAAAAERAVGGLWRRDASVWSNDPAVRQQIANRLGWLSVPSHMSASIERLHEFADRVRRDGFNDVVLLGMGGSSLAPEVLRAVLGVAAGWPRFHMLDSTDPAAVAAAATPPGKTLYLLASKSGTTIEPNSLAAHFRQRLEAAGISKWADHFAAITDEGTELSARARAERFRDVFINPSDIGGRYSAMSFFGLVPAALMGQDISSLIAWAEAMIVASAPDGAAVANPAAGLGLAMASAASAGRDKLTLVSPPLLEPFGLWIEQLVAESTGKQGVGIIPIAGETPGARAVYGADRLFVRMSLQGFPSPEGDTGDAPIADIDLQEPAALGAEFVRWEIATAIAGALLRINPFDEPNVQQAKDATRSLLEQYKSTGRLPEKPADAETPDGVTMRLSASAKRGLAGRLPEAFLRLVTKGDYVAILAYLGPDAGAAEAMHRFRMNVRDRTRAATMFGYGPRYLHSTGQLHKGGPDSGLFVMVTARPASDVPIPGEAFSFGTLELAQALGDFASLDAAGRRVLHVHLPAPGARLIQQVADLLLRT
jgi:glucose-6-phosphate isomerase